MSLELLTSRTDAEGHTYELWYAPGGVFALYNGKRRPYHYLVRLITKGGLRITSCVTKADAEEMMRPELFNETETSNVTEK